MRLSWQLLTLLLPALAESGEIDTVVSPVAGNVIVTSTELTLQAKQLYEEGVALLSHPDGSGINSAVAKLDHALQLGHDAAAVHLADLYYFGRLNFEPDYGKCASYLSNCNDPECHFLLGLFHSNGLGGKTRSIPHKLAYYAMAAEKKHTGALMALGWMHSAGAQVTKSCLKARDYYFSVATEMAKEVESERRTSFPKAVRLSHNRSEKSSTSRDVVDFYQYNADSGDATALLFLGQVFYLGVGGVDRDMGLARDYFTKAADLGNAAATGYLGQMDYYGEGLEKPNKREAYHKFRRASKEKNAIALNGMGLLYWKGVEVMKDLDEAAKYFKQAADLDHSEAYYNLGRVYTEIDPVRHDDTIFGAYIAALRGGYVLAGYELAKLNMHRDVTCNLAKTLLLNVLEKHPSVSLVEEANDLFTRGRFGAALSRFLYIAEQGNDAAQYNAAFLLDHMARSKNNQEEIESLRRRALVWWSLSAASNGEAPSLVALGDYMYKGWGIEQPDPISAAAYYHKAIEKRSPQAAFNLAYLHQYGIGVPLDLNMARRYYEQAATLGKSNEEPEAWLPCYLALRLLAIQQRVERMRRTFRELPPWTVTVATVIIFGATTLLLAVFKFGLGTRPVMPIRPPSIPVMISGSSAENDTDGLKGTDHFDDKSDVAGPSYTNGNDANDKGALEDSPLLPGSPDTIPDDPVTTPHKPFLIITPRTKDKNRLIVKDMAPSKVFSTVLDAVDYPKTGVSTYKCTNGLELVTCAVDSPLYAVYVAVPTFVEDHKGLPHTLEHLIFCGSVAYPERGYLDRLAGLCQSQGTNAYTSDDHTCYTLMTSSLAGLLRLLPVFLDHIFRPTLSETVVRREVFHRGTAGGRGVVYCEMAGREWSEQDQLDLALRRSTIGGVYGWECGGRTKDIATLTLQEIKDYHARWYRPENVCVVLCGAGLDAELDGLLELLDSVQFYPTPSPIHPPSEPVIEKQSSVLIPFPANDESLGSVGFAWTGPTSDNMYTITALHVLLRMLKDTSASPLYQHFVERSDPIASDIDYEVKPAHQTMLSIIFSGIPTDGKDGKCYLDEGVLWTELEEVLRAIRTDEEMLEERRKVALKSLKIKLQESLEDDPHDFCAGYCMPEIVRARWPFAKTTEPGRYGESITRVPQHLEELAQQPLSYWTELIDHFLLGPPPAEVRMKPSRTMNESIKTWETEQLKNIPVIELSEEEYQVTQEIAPFDTGKLAAIPCTIHRPSPAVQIVSLPISGVKRLTLAFDIAKCIPEPLWPYLVLLQELFFQCDLEITDTLLTQFPSPLLTEAISYQELIEELSGVFSTFETAVGFDSDIFSCGYFESHFVVSLHGRVVYTLEELRNLCMLVLHGTVFSADRVAEVLENLISQLKDTWGEAHSVLDMRLTTRLGECAKAAKRPRCRMAPTIEKHLGMATQTKFLVQLREQLEEQPDSVISSLEQLRQHLVESPMLTHFGTNEDGSQPTSTDSHSFWEDPYRLPKQGTLEGETVNEGGEFELIPMSDITSSYLMICVPLDVLPRSAEYDDATIDRLLSTALLCQLLSYTEGPLFRRIRGAGLAYGASISVAVWSGLLTAHLDDSSDPVRAFTTFIALLEELLSAPANVITDEAVRTAQAGMQFQFVTERATPAGIVATACRTALRGLPSVGSDEERRWNSRMLAMDVPQLTRAAQELLLVLKDATRAIRLAAVPASKLDAIKAEFDALSIPSTVNNIVDLAHLLN
ncbi:hypothetical protein PSACC_00061 [Paramicrosporidium saccamoebae]|uniref:Uncharacterized protein n=1 Tax=Paramicrosporidium saccamoebae TaxID=1246581 RepID=A0A2H9TQW6_9FUNG|nr:hypothetical protein PSACC_00061 [Paramicrosporidium saccamoebae]